MKVPALPAEIVLLLAHHVQLVNQLRIFLHLSHHLLILAPQHFISARCDLHQALLHVPQVASQLLSRVVRLPAPPRVLLLLCYVGLVEPHDVGVPVLLVGAVDQREYFGAEVVVGALLVLERDAQVAHFPLADLGDALQLLNAGEQLRGALLLLPVLRLELEHFGLELVDLLLLGLQLLSNLGSAEAEHVLRLL